MRITFPLLISYLFLFSFVLPVNAQQTARFSDPARDYKEALEIYDQQKYNIAYQRFEAFIEHYEDLDDGKSRLLLADAHYYKASCALRQQDPKAESFYLAYLGRFKGHSFNNIAYFDLGNLYFSQRQYKDALAYYNRVNDRALNKKFYEEYAFKTGFCYFSLKQFDTARMAWRELIFLKDSEYYMEANYYYGMASYYDGDYGDAIASFRKVESDSRYRNVVPYYITQITFLQKDYQGVINYAVPVLEKRSVQYKADMSQLIGQAYFELGNYKEAARYLGEYIRDARNVTKEDYYQVGYAQYQNGDYADAVNSFKALNHLNNALAQNALFLTGNAYLKLNDKANARTALQRAASMNFDAGITEEASFQFAKLSYELGFNNEALTALRKYLQQYPTSAHIDEANELLADLLLQTKNYDEALAIIEQIPQPSVKIREAYQLMAYHKAISLYNDGRLNHALEVFNKAERYTPDKSLLALTKYWRGDIYHRKGQYQQSNQEVEQFLAAGITVKPEHSRLVSKATAHYMQGYNYYKLNDFSKAGTAFRAAATELGSTPDDELRNRLLPDALLRSADCHYLQREYNKALTYYEQVIQKAYEGSDYAYYQKANIAGLNRQYDQKIAHLETLRRSWPSSVLVDDALFEIANTYLQTERPGPAATQFKNLVATYPTSEWVAPSYIKMGLIYFNEDNYDEALRQYKTVVSKFPKTTASAEALLAIRDVYIAKGDPQGYIKFLDNVPGASVTVSQQDSLLYLSAENQFTRGDYDKALRGFSDYLLRFPEGYFSLPAHFYRGECHFSFQDFSKAIIDYNYVLKQARNRFTERTLQRAAGINYYHLKDYTAALEQYLELIGQASTEDVRLQAVLGIMRSNFQLKDYRATIEYTNRVAGDDLYSDQQQSEAYYYRAKSYWNTNDRTKAIADYKTVRQRVSNEWAAEAAYYIALNLYDRGLLTEAETACFDFIRNYPSYATWLVQTYVLLADVYIKQDNLFQAKATVQSVLDNYKKDDEWRALAVAKYAEIERLEKGRSKIVEPDRNNGEIKFDE